MIGTWPPGLGQGASGLRGFLGGLSLAYRFESGTSEPPSSGRVRLNHATPASATRVYIHDTDRDGVNLDALLDLFAIGTIVKIFREDSPRKFAIYRVTAASDDGAHHDFTVVYVAGNDTFADGGKIGIGIVATAAPLSMDEASDSASGTVSYSGSVYPVWSSALLTVAYTQLVVGDVFAHANAASMYDGSFNTEVIVGIAIDAGTPVVLGYASNNTLGDGRFCFVGGACRFAGIAAGSRSVTLHISRPGGTGIVRADEKNPLRLTVVHP